MFTPRALWIALALIPLDAAWIFQMEVVRYSGHPTTISLFFNTLFLLAVLLALNGAIRKLRPASALRPAELLGIHTLLSVAAAIGGHDMIEVLVPLLAHPAYHADAVNQWDRTLLPHLPPALVVLDRDALTGFHRGNASLYTADVLRAWALPVVCWTGLLTLLGALYLSLGTLVRRHWNEDEKLPFPLVTVPLAMVDPNARLFRNRLFLAGLALAAALEIWNGLATLHPSLPLLPLKRFDMAQDVKSWLVAPPWNSVEGMSVALYPFGIGLGMLLPTDLLLSSWVFAWVWQLERVVGTATGIGQWPGFPFVEAQSAGALLGLAASLIWGGRRAIRSSFATAFARTSPSTPESRELRIAWSVAGAGSVAFLAICRAMGMQWSTATLFLALFLLSSLAIARIRAELGPPAHDFSNTGPDEILPLVLPGDTLSQGDRIGFSLFYGFNRAYRGHPMPFLLEGMAAGHRTGTSPRAVATALGIAVVAGCLAGFWAALDQSYRYGVSAKMAPPLVGAMFGGEPWTRLEGWLGSPPTGEKQFLTRMAVCFGFAVCFLLGRLRAALPAFALHPVGYAISSNWSMGLLWLPMLIAWIAKVALLRYGGLSLYKRWVPFFIGIVLGEAIVGSLWSLIGIGWDIPTYAFWP